MTQTRAHIFKNTPEGLPVPGKDLVIEAVDFDFNAAPPPGGIVVKMRYSSLDPFLRKLLDPPTSESHPLAFTPGQVFSSVGIAEVVKSDNAAFEVGDLVKGFLQHQEYYSIPKELLQNGNNASGESPPGAMFKVGKLDNPLGLDPRDFLGALDLPGLTAYTSLYDIGKPHKGETIFVSAASGGVGAVVGQLAKLEGLRVIGSVGSDEKLNYITNDLGFDAGFNHRKERPADALKRLAPEGLDIYYDNVGGEAFEAAIDAMKVFGRIVVCGMVSQYNLQPEEYYPVRNLMNVVAKRLTVRGFVVADYGPEWAEEHVKNLSAWIKDGSFKTLVSETPFEQDAEGFVGMLQGKNFGKAIVKY